MMESSLSEPRNPGLGLPWLARNLMNRSFLSGQRIRTQPCCRPATPHRRHGMVDQAISEHRAAEGSADERCHHRVSQPGAAQPNRKCERFWTLPQKHFVQARLMGIKINGYSFDAMGKRILDIGGGPVSMIWGQAEKHDRRLSALIRQYQQHHGYAPFEPGLAAFAFH
jgi:hypothetical protein